MDNTKTKHPVTIRFTELQMSYLKQMCKHEGNTSINAYVRKLIMGEIEKASIN